MSLATGNSSCVFSTSKCGSTDVYGVQLWRDDLKRIFTENIAVGLQRQTVSQWNCAKDGPLEIICGYH